VSMPRPKTEWKPGLAGLVALAVSGIAVLAGVSVYLVGYFQAGDRLPRNAVVADVPVGGLSIADAEAKLSSTLGPRAEAPVHLTVSGDAHVLDPTTVGLGVDVPASITRAGGGRSLHPLHIWRALTGGAPVDAVTTVDEARLRSAVASLAKDVNSAAKNATLAYDGTSIEQTRAVDGVQLNQEETVERIRTGYLSTVEPIEMVADVTEPEISTAEVEQVITDFARPAVSGPIRLKADESDTFEVSPKMIAKAITFTRRDGTLTPQLDASRLYELAQPVLDDANLTKPKDATIEIVDGKPKIIRSVNGITVKADVLAAAVQGALTKQGKARKATVVATTEEPDFTTADAKRLGVEEITGKFTTRFPYAEYRNHNIGRAAELIHNTLLMPGETFSLNKTLGERTRKNGYVRGYIIRDGRFRMELGGGVSQSATTTFNAAFFAGLKDVEHRPHGLYIDRYPAGREATVFWPSLDLRFKNNTDYGVLIQARAVDSTPTKQGRITVRMWSTKSWDKVESSELRRSNFTSGPVVQDNKANCEPQAAVQGFDVNYQRLFYRDGDVVKKEKFYWRYKPTSQVICI
jgi:vancomycin resistance protein YoaR